MQCAPQKVDDSYCFVQTWLLLQKEDQAISPSIISTPSAIQLTYCQKSEANGSPLSRPILDVKFMRPSKENTPFLVLLGQERES